MSFQPAVNSDWQPKDIEVLREQYHKLGRFYLDRLISGSLVSIDEFRKGLALLHSLQSNTRTPCSAGCADVMIDPVGDIYPCTRFGPHLCGGQFRLGSIGESFNDRLREVFLNYNIPEDVRADCLGCRARSTCRDWCNAACAELTLSLYDPGTTFCEAKRALHDEILEIDDYLRCHHPDLLDGVIQGRTNV